MTAIAQDYWQDQEDEPAITVEGRVDARLEEAYWQTVYWGESYYRADLDYEDYAPAYCVGYIGYAQYGGAYADAEKCLLANWLRIKGDSRLTLDEARQAIRAAWERAARTEERVDEEEDDEVVQVALPMARPVQQQPAYA